MRVINLNSSEETDTIYIGRAVPEHGLQASSLGNPFTIEQYGRAQCIELYRAWLWEKIEAEDSQVLAALNALNEDSILACWCKPEACHGDVVMAAWKWMHDDRSQPPRWRWGTTVVK